MLIFIMFMLNFDNYILYLHQQTTDKGNDKIITFGFDWQGNKKITNNQKSSLLMKKKTIKCIVIPRGMVNEIMQEIGCSQNTVYRALRCESASAMADRIRELAIAKGGAITNRVTFKPTITL